MPMRFWSSMTGCAEGCNGGNSSNTNVVDGRIMPNHTIITTMGKAILEPEYI
jgi:hypothetical protein